VAAELAKTGVRNARPPRGDRTRSVRPEAGDLDQVATRQQGQTGRVAAMHGEGVHNRKGERGDDARGDRTRGNEQRSFRVSVLSFMRKNEM
jgi:hypothetical protein